MGCWGSKFRDNPKRWLWIVITGSFVYLWGFCGCGIGCDDHEEKEEKKRTMTLNHKTNMKTKNSIIRMMTMKQVFHSSCDRSDTDPKTHLKIHHESNYISDILGWLECIYGFPRHRRGFPCWVLGAPGSWALIAVDGGAGTSVIRCSGHLPANPDKKISKSIITPNIYI